MDLVYPSQANNSGTNTARNRDRSRWMVRPHLDGQLHQNHPDRPQGKVAMCPSLGVHPTECSKNPTQYMGNPTLSNNILTNAKTTSANLIRRSVWIPERNSNALLFPKGHRLLSNSHRSAIGESGRSDWESGDHPLKRIDVSFESFSGTGLAQRNLQGRFWNTSERKFYLGTIQWIRISQ
jgi:hypothetical protein